MLSVISLCSILRESFGFRCGNSVEVFHSLSSSVLLRWKSSSMLLRCVPSSLFIRNSIRVVGDLMQSWDFFLDMSWAPSCLDRMCWTSPLYMIPSLPLSFRAFLSCSLIHLR